MNIASIVAHPDDAEIWMGGTLLSYLNKGNNIYIIYPLNINRNRQKEAKINKIFKSIFTENLLDSISSIKPNLIFTHWYDDVHEDHKKISKMVSGMLPDLLAFRNVNPRVFYFGTYNNLGRSNIFQPIDFVDITKYFEEKIKLISVYKSQNPKIWINMIKNINSFHGQQSGVKYAEGFIEVPVMGILKRAKEIL